MQGKDPSLLPGLCEALWPLSSAVTSLISQQAPDLYLHSLWELLELQGLDVTLALIPVPSHLTPISLATILMIPTGFPDGKRKINVISTIQMEKGYFFFPETISDAGTQELLIHLVV